MSLVDILSRAQSEDANARKTAEAELVKYEVEHYNEFLKALCVEFVTDGKPQITRQLAGLYLKNLVTGQSHDIVAVKSERWRNCDATIKEAARQSFFQALVSADRTISQTASQVIAAYACVDLKNGEWESVLPQLVGYCAAADCPELTKVSTLKCLGFICELLDEDVLKVEQTNQILTGIVRCMDASMPNSIRAAATEAMCNSLVFCEKNFEAEAERNMIMESICGSMVSEDDDTRLFAYCCLESVAENYYEHIKPYIDTLYPLTVKSIKEDEEDVAMHAVEFWIIIASNETELNEEGRAHHGITQTLVTIGTLLPLILSKFTEQAESPEDEDESLCSCCYRFLLAAAECVGDDIANAVMPMIQEHLMSENWRFKDAAINAFAYVLNGPNIQTISPFVQQAMPAIVESTQHGHDMVANSALWAVSQVCLFHKNAIKDPQTLVKAVLSSLTRQNHKVQYQALNCMLELAEACDEHKDRKTNLLSTFFVDAVQSILAVAAAGGDDEKLYKDNVFIAYETVNKMIENSAEDMLPLVQKILIEAVARLEATLTPACVLSTANKHYLQGYAAALISQCVQKLPLGPESLPVEMSDRIMNALLMSTQDDSNSCISDIIMAVGFVVEHLEDRFERYHQNIMPILLKLLDNFDDSTTLVVVVGVLGDLCRVWANEDMPRGDLIMGPDFKLSDAIMQKLLELLKSDAVSLSVKPITISFFADIAMALGKDFVRYAATVMEVLNKACQTAKFGVDDEDHNDFVSKIRESILEAYTGIIQGFKGTPELACMKTYVEGIVHYSTGFGIDAPQGGTVADDVLKAAVGTIGDTASVFGKEMKHILHTKPVQDLINAGKLSRDKDVKENTGWAEEELMKL